MTKKIILILLTCIQWIINSSSVVNAGNGYTKTPWKTTEKSLGELLSSGWKIVGHTGYRVIVLPATLSASDSQTLSYILHKDGKYINCFVINPRPDDAYSGCREIN
jgi:hypothetical protein